MPFSRPTPFLTWTLAAGRAAVHTSACLLQAGGAQTNRAALFAPGGSHGSAAGFLNEQNVPRSRFRGGSAGLPRPQERGTAGGRPRAPLFRRSVVRGAPPGTCWPPRPHARARAQRAAGLNFRASRRAPGFQGALASPARQGERAALHFKAARVTTENQEIGFRDPSSHPGSRAPKAAGCGDPRRGASPRPAVSSRDPRSAASLCGLARSEIRRGAARPASNPQQPVGRRRPLVQSPPEPVSSPAGPAS